MAQVRDNSKNTDELIREGKRAQSYLDIAQVILVAIDNQAQITLLNRKGHQILGYENGELIGKNWFKTCLHPDECETVLNAFNKIISGELENFEQYENHVLTKTGQTRLISWKNTLLRDEMGCIIGTLSSGEDITERRRAEAALLRSESLLHAIVDNFPDSYISIIEKDLSVGPSFGQAFKKLGLDPNQFVGTTLEQVFGEHAPVVRENYLKTFGGEETRFELSINNQHQHYRTVPLPELDGSIHRILAVVEDVTERKRVEQTLNESLVKLKEKELSKTRFFAAAGHDLRQPLAAANLFIDALKSTEPTPEQDKLIQNLDCAMSTFKGLLDSLLKVSKLDSGVVKPDLTPINVTEVFNWLELNFAPMATEKQLGFRLHFPMKETFIVLCDTGLLNSILANLVANAIKFTSKGAILISARKRGLEVLFQVWDTGEGISKEQIDKIFDEFYQIGNPQRDRISGLGLGLSIAKRAIELLNSEIKCRSRIGRGSVFEFRLPLDGKLRGVQQVATWRPKNEAPNLSFAQGKRFIVVEDDRLVAQALTQSLEGLGGEVECFHNAEDALCHANIGFADYYIIDYMLGGTLDGMEFLNTLRQKLGKPINAVLVTGDTSTNIIQKTAGFDWQVLYKPVNAAELISALSTQEGKHA